MKRQTKIWQTALALIACCGTMLPSSVFAADSPRDTQADKVPSQDYELTEAGRLTGRLVNVSGAALGKTEVTLYSTSKAPRSTMTEEDGQFVFDGVRGGTYVVSTAKTDHAMRVWAAGTAPPNAVKSALLVDAETTVRGQGINPVRNVIRSPAFLGVVIAGGIVLPLVLSKDAS